MNPRPADRPTWVPPPLNILSLIATRPCILGYCTFRIAKSGYQQACDTLILKNCRGRLFQMKSPASSCRRRLRQVAERYSAGQEIYRILVTGISPGPFGSDTGKICRDFVTNPPEICRRFAEQAGIAQQSQRSKPDPTTQGLHCGGKSIADRDGFAADPCGRGWHFMPQPYIAVSLRYHLAEIARNILKLKLDSLPSSGGRRFESFGGRISAAPRPRKDR